MPDLLPLPVDSCPLCGGPIRVNSYGSEYHLVCRQCFKTVRIWGPVKQAWRDPSVAEAPAAPVLPLTACPRCKGKLFEKEPKAPGYVELVCVTCAHAEFARYGDGPWTPIQREPTEQQRREAEDARLVPHSDGHVAKAEGQCA